MKRTKENFDGDRRLLESKGMVDCEEPDDSLSPLDHHFAQQEEWLSHSQWSESNGGRLFQAVERVRSFLQFQADEADIRRWTCTCYDLDDDPTSSNPGVQEAWTHLLMSLLAERQEERIHMGVSVGEDDLYEWDVEALEVVDGEPSQSESSSLMTTFIPDDLAADMKTILDEICQS